jgi:hypothetical protein
MLNETTDGNGASSPTTKTEPEFEPPPPFDPDPALQPIRKAAMNTSNTNARNFLISEFSKFANSGLNNWIVTNTCVQTHRLSQGFTIFSNR